MPAVLSACLVMYHCGDEIDHALRCLENADLEVAVYLCDNSPDDMTAERLQWNFPGVTVLPMQENTGYGKAHNAVLPYLQSTYHLLMHPDVNFDPSLLRRMILYMEAHPNIAILIPRVMNEDGTEQFLPKQKLSVRALLGGLLRNFGRPFRTWREKYTMEDMEVHLPTPVECAAGCFMIIRTQTFLRLGGFDPRFFLYQADCDLSRRILDENLGSIVYHPDFRVIHLHAQGNEQSFRGRMRQLRSAVQYFRKWGLTW